MFKFIKKAAKLVFITVPYAFILSLAEAGKWLFWKFVAVMEMIVNNISCLKNEAKKQQSIDDSITEETNIANGNIETTVRINLAAGLREVLEIGDKKKKKEEEEEEEEENYDDDTEEFKDDEYEDKKKKKEEKSKEGLLAIAQIIQCPSKKDKEAKENVEANDLELKEKSSNQLNELPKNLKRLYKKLDEKLGLDDENKQKLKKMKKAYKTIKTLITEASTEKTKISSNNNNQPLSNIKPKTSIICFTKKAKNSTNPQMFFINRDKLNEQLNEFISNCPNLSLDKIKLS